MNVATQGAESGSHYYSIAGSFETIIFCQINPSEGMNVFTLSKLTIIL